MKTITYILVSIFLCLVGCQSPSSNENLGSDSISEADPVQQYVDKCKASKTVPPLGHFGWGEVKRYWEKVPELQSLRNEFEKTDEALLNELKKDDEFRDAYNALKASSGDEHKIKREEYNHAKSNAYSRLMKREDFRLIFEIRQNALFTSNIQTLEYIIDDYEKQGKEFPVDWFEKTRFARKKGKYVRTDK